MRVLVIIEEPFHTKIRRKVIEQMAKTMLGHLALQKAELSIVLTGDEQIQRFNRIYRKKDRPTDVLAFPMQEGELGGVNSEILGDILISIPTACRQAEKIGRDLISEVTFLLAHGLLHLLGWDHDTPERDQQMRAEVDQLCNLT